MKIEKKELPSPKLKKLGNSLSKIEKSENYLELERKKLVKEKEVIRSKIKKEREIIDLKNKIKRIKGRKK